MDPIQALAAVVTTLTGEIVKLQERVDALEPTLRDTKDLVLGLYDRVVALEKAQASQTK